jgi:hypothetical protein
MALVVRPEPGANLTVTLPGTGSRHPGRDDGVGCAGTTELAGRGRRSWLCGDDGVGWAGTAGQAPPERWCHLVIPAEPAPDLFRGCRNPEPRKATSMLAPRCEMPAPRWESRDPNRGRTRG